MNLAGWIFLVTFWTILIVSTYWSYRVLLSEPNIPRDLLEDEMTRPGK
ncbi:MAG: hypothetical protein K8T10_11475 [Candidatus Eremiobacteraeota bacterium]|nr:hypothetical protein [Candidatus Eremiobacteraeota bacterium]